MLGREAATARRREAERDVGAVDECVEVGGVVLLPEPLPVGVGVAPGVVGVSDEASPAGLLLDEPLELGWKPRDRLLTQFLVVRLEPGQGSMNQPRLAGRRRDQMTTTATTSAMRAPMVPAARYMTAMSGTDNEARPSASP